ncbi:MAG: hypothetical protein HY079_14370 [Elusimicrobia bacterium]|nr:hypothetical protein [Elusimicrobiota bacterium]
MKSLAAAALLILFPVLAAAVAPGLELRRGVETYRVASAQVLADPTNALTIEGLRALEKDGRAAWKTTERFNFGYTTTRRWLKLTVANQDTAEGDWLLELCYPLVQGVEFHQFTGGRHVAGNKTGKLLPFRNRAVAYHNFLFPFSAPKGGTTELYVMAESNGTLFVPLGVVSKNALLAKSALKTTAVGVYVGIIAAMVLSNLFLFFAFRDRNYLYYVVYATTFCLLLGSLNGMSYQYLWPDWPAWNKVCVPVLVGVSYLFLALFTKSFLETRRLAPRMNLGLNAVLAGALFLIVGGAFHYGLFVNRFTSLFISAVPFVMIPISARCVQRGSGAAIYYLIAFGCFFLGSSTHAARDLGWLPQNFVIDNGPYLGSAAEMLLLSLGLAARIKRLKDDKHRFELQTAEARRELAENKEKLAKEEGAAALAARVAHDIRSPLAVLDVVEKDPESGRALLRPAIRRIRDIANTLVARKQAGAELHSGPSEPTVEPLASLADLILSEKRLEHRKEDGIAIEADFAVDARGLFARVEPSALMRDLSNLVTNAVESVGTRGRVVVALREEDGRAVLTVEDDGPGISSEILSRMGEKGFTHGKPGGQGLGVHHARADAQAWGGALKIESAPGRGTRVHLRLPLTPPPAWFLPHLELRPGGGVVVLDDDPSIHQVWQERLTASGASGNLRISHFFRAAELRDWARTKPSLARDAVYLVDYELEGERTTGLDLIAELGLADRAVLVTSRADERAVVETCLRLGVKLLPKSSAAFLPLAILDEARV